MPNVHFTGVPDGSFLWEYSTDPINTTDLTILHSVLLTGTYGPAPDQAAFKLEGQRVPEPGTLLFLSFGLLGLGALRKKFKK